jgi:hypothetical protein
MAAYIARKNAKYRKNDTVKEEQNIHEKHTLHSLDSDSRHPFFLKGCSNELEL